jgi:hypothetical protein
VLSNSCKRGWLCSANILESFSFFLIQ